MMKRPTPIILILVFTLAFLSSCQKKPVNADVKLLNQAIKSTNQLSSYHFNSLLTIEVEGKKNKVKIYGDWQAPGEVHMFLATEASKREVIITGKKAYSRTLIINGDVRKSKWIKGDQLRGQTSPIEGIGKLRNYRSLVKLPAIKERGVVFDRLKTTYEGKVFAGKGLGFTYNSKASVKRAVAKAKLWIAKKSHRIIKLNLVISNITDLSNNKLNVELTVNLSKLGKKVAIKAPI
jgi:hypothetical protein